MLKLEYRFRPSVVFTSLCWGCLLFVIEMFFVIAPITSSYIHMALVMLMAVGGAVCVFIRFPAQKIRLSFFLFAFIVFHAFLSLRAIMTGNARSITDLLFYLSGLLLVFCAGSFRMNADQTEKLILRVLVYFGLFFSAGIFLQVMFTDLFLRYQLPLLSSDFRHSLRRQVEFHHMYTGWTSQTFATCINLMLGIYGALLSWERTKKKRCLASALVMLGAFLLTGKRGPLVFMMFAYFLTTVALSGSFDKMIRIVWKYAVAVVVAAVGLILYVSTHASTSRNTIVRFMEMFNGTGINRGDMSNGRFELWGFALELFCSNPLFGVGWRRYHELALIHLHEDIEAHNVYLQVLAECGIFGLLLYMIPVISGLVFTFLYLKKMQNRRDSSIYRLMKLSLAVQLYFFFYAATGNTLYDYCAQICYYFVFAICMYAKNNSYLSWKELKSWIKL